MKPPPTSEFRLRSECSASVKLLVSEETERRTTQLDSKTLVGKFNRMMTGWANYFRLGPVSKAYDAVDRHAKKRLRQWLCTKHNSCGSIVTGACGQALAKRLDKEQLT
jgi:hypothetical protein